MVDVNGTFFMTIQMHIDPTLNTFLYLDNLVVVNVVQSIGSIPSSDNRGISQEICAMDSILEIKLEEDFMFKRSLSS